MNYFKSPCGKIHALSDEDIARGGNKLLPAGSIPTDAPVITIDPWLEYQRKARHELRKVQDLSIDWECQGIEFPATWSHYYLQLKAIINATSGDSTQQPLPTPPELPTGAV